MSASARPEKQRLFFALWPDAALRAHLAAGAAAATAGIAGKPTPPEKLHLTLLFLGNLEAHLRATAETAAASIRAPGFELTIDQPGWFRGARVVWIGPRILPAALTQLRQALATALRAAEIPFDENDFHPHVTCLRQAQTAPRGGVEPVRWPVRDFVLVHSHRSEYRVVGRWALAG